MYACMKTFVFSFSWFYVLENIFPYYPERIFYFVIERYYLTREEMKFKKII